MRLRPLRTCVTKPEWAGSFRWNDRVVAGTSRVSTNATGVRPSDPATTSARNTCRRTDCAIAASERTTPLDQRAGAAQHNAQIQELLPRSCPSFHPRMPTLMHCTHPGMRCLRLGSHFTCGGCYSSFAVQQFWGFKAVPWRSSDGRAKPVWRGEHQNPLPGPRARPLPVHIR